MKTKQEWDERYYSDDDVTFPELVELIQSDARDGMVPAAELRAVEAERDRYKAALEEITRSLQRGSRNPISIAMEALQPAQKDAPEKGTK